MNLYHRNNFKKLVLKAAGDIIGEARNGQATDWFDEECRMAIQEKIRNIQQILQQSTRAAHEEYRITRRIADKTIKIKKKYLKNKIEELEQFNKANKNEKFYYAMKSMINGSGTNTICDANGNIVKDENDISRY